VWDALRAGADKAADRLASGTASAEEVRHELDFLAKAVYRRATDGNRGENRSAVAIQNSLKMRFRFFPLFSH
jgi:hypothetical protein